MKSASVARILFFWIIECQERMEQRFCAKMQKFECFKRTKIVMYSSFMREQEIEECKSLGVYDCLAKSSDFQQLRDCLKKPSSMRSPDFHMALKRFLKEKGRALIRSVKMLGIYHYGKQDRD